MSTEKSLAICGVTGSTARTNRLLAKIASRTMPRTRPTEGGPAADGGRPELFFDKPIMGFGCSQRRCGIAHFAAEGFPPMRMALPTITTWGAYSYIELD